MTENEIPVEKDDENEGPVPTIWRPIFENIVNAFVKKDYLLESGVAGVSPISEDTANQINEYIEDYGEDLVQLPEETWETSVYIWMDPHWDVLVDLWTAGEGLSDLVLRAEVSEKDSGYNVRVALVYVP